MNTLLWVLAFVGVWNGINLAARVYYENNEWHRHLYSVLIGFWAIWILWCQQ